MNNAPLVYLRDLKVRFAGSPPVHALQGVTLTLAPGEVLGILGESGSGKSVTLKALLRLLPPKKTTISGAIEIDGRDVLTLAPAELARLRGGVAAMIFQDPGLALDPVYTIGDQLAETVMRHAGMGAKAAREAALGLLERVRIPSPERRLSAYPHELSGGMRQRAMIALALAGQPKLLLADEPTTALDATVQMQILLLLRQLQRDLGMGVIFVTHDIGVAVEICDRIAIMYAGQIVETGPVRALMRDPRHPYTRALLAANLHGAKKGERLDAIAGAPPALDTPPVGCAFAPRCNSAFAACACEVPGERDLGGARKVRCHLPAANAPASA